MLGKTHRDELGEGRGAARGAGGGGVGSRGGRRGLVVRLQVFLSADDADARVHVDLPRAQALPTHIGDLVERVYTWGLYVGKWRGESEMLGTKFDFSQNIIMRFTIRGYELMEMK